ncbi:uncharacterized protein LOC111803757 [Cucurbita pepo subsp. pepo]|uniref:uncharacterized protein LOC111803757 n=1 Tax=Cucurbita pepo subsp. pepo TaxID=3664 RepID=UPI000C9D5AFF|nr:uncharacterized protein LOC111803757 [Cucurbita pepo subsp. pepo]
MATFGPIPLHHAVTIRLTKNNFIIWRAQLLPYLRSTKLMGYLDGTNAAPAKMVPSSTAADAELIRVELATSKKRDQSAVNYFCKIKELATELAAADSALQDDDVIAYLLAGLGPDYDPFVTSMTTKSEALTLDDVGRVELQLNLGSSANYASHGGQQKNHGRRDRGRGRSQGYALSRPGGDRRGPSARLSCQICGKVGHTVIRC